MPKLEVLNSNMFKKTNTGADFNRALGVLKDNIVVATATHESTRIVPVGFKYLPEKHELEVYVNGVFKRVNETIESVEYGDYDEYSNFSVRFNTSVISAGDIIRFRVTSANYKIVNGVNQTELTTIRDNITQLGVDEFGTGYVLGGFTTGSTRTIGSIPNYQTVVNLANYRTWLTATTGATITNFTGCLTDDIRYIIFRNNTTTIKNNANIVLQDGQDLTGSEGQILTLINVSGVWFEQANSARATASTLKVSEIISQTSWNLAVEGDTYEVDVSEGAEKNVIIECYDENNEKFYPVNIEIYNANQAFITMPTDSTSTVTYTVSTSLSELEHTIASEDWSVSGDLYYYDVDMGTVDSTASIIVCYDLQTNQQIFPNEIIHESPDDSTKCRIYMTEALPLLVIINEADFNHEIETGDWSYDAGEDSYYNDVDISSTDSTSIVTCFIDSSTNYQILPQKVVKQDENTLRIWMPSNTVGLFTMIDSQNNFSGILNLTGSVAYMTYYYDIDISTIASTDIVVNYFNNSTSRFLPIDKTSYDAELLNINTIRVWSEVNTIPIKVVIAG